MLLKRSDIDFLYELQEELFKQKHRTLSPRKKRELHKKAYMLWGINERLFSIYLRECESVNK